MDLDDPDWTNHISAQVEHPLPPWQQSPARTYEKGKTNVIFSQREDLFTIQFESLKPIVISLMVKMSMVETSVASNDDE